MKLTSQQLNKLTSQQRKLVYLIGIVLLLIPVIMLGQPSGGMVDGKEKPGGALTELRNKYDLGENDLGAVDASGAAINLVLLGMRGVAVNLLWIELDKQRDMKRWYEMEATTESIVRLQPHYEKVWDINGWNLAYNTSAEWDAVPDRYRWVKKGAKLLMRGVQRNQQATELYYRTAKVIDHKIGMADESVDYRKYFVNDPAPEFKGGVDPEINPEGKDNYLVAKVWYQDSIVHDEKRAQHILDRSLFLGSPGHCQLSYAQALQKEGKFGEETRAAWEMARRDWTEDYGRKVIHTEVGSEKFDIQLEWTDEDIKQAAKTPDDELRYRRHVDLYQKTTNYRYWRTRAFAESEPVTAEAHRDLYESKMAYTNQEFELAQKKALSGMTGFDTLMKRPEYQELVQEEQLVEECLLAWRIWDDIHRLQESKVPEDYPLKWLVQQKLATDESLVKSVNRQFNRLLEKNR